MNTIFGVGSGPHQKQTSASETWQAFEHSLLAMLTVLLMIGGLLVEALLFGRISGTVFLCMASFVAAGYSPSMEVWIVSSALTGPGIIFSYFAAFGLWPEFVIDWQYWPWAQFALAAAIPAFEFILYYQLKRQVNESYLPSLLNSITASPGKLKQGPLVDGVSYTEKDDGSPTVVHWS